MPPGLITSPRVDWHQPLGQVYFLVDSFPSHGRGLMIARADLRRIARMRLRDAEVLFKGRRFDGAIYVCGYAVELTLKARICTTLRWAGFPSTGGEFKNYGSFKIHDFEVLLRLGGREAVVRSAHVTDWSVVMTWEPEFRYHLPGATTRPTAASMIESTRRLMRVL